MAAGPAAVAGVPGKGTIEVGADADLVWYEPGRRIAVDGRLLAHRNKLSAYTGRVLSGSVSRTIVRGRTVFDGERVPDPQCRAMLRGRTTARAAGAATARVGAAVLGHG